MLTLVVWCLIEDLLFVGDKYVACLWAVSETIVSNKKTMAISCLH